MTDEAALLRAITAHADDDTPRLVYADWLDENRPDPRPSPAEGPSARGEFIRAQCRLAAGAFDETDYPEHLERDLDLAAWLNTHDPDPYLAIDHLHCNNLIECGEWSTYRRGFPEVLEFDELGDDPLEMAEILADALEVAFRKCPARTLRLEEATAEEIERLAQRPVFSRLRGLRLDYLSDSEKDLALAKLASAPRAAGLRRLFFDFPVGRAGCDALAKSPYLRVESLVLEYPTAGAGAIAVLAQSRWFRNLRRLHLWLGTGDVLRILAELPLMPRLVSLTLQAELPPNTESMRRFAASESFPRLAHLDLRDCRLSAEHVAALAQARWLLRHLALGRNEIRRLGCEALAGAEFAPTLRVLDLNGAEVTTGGVQLLSEAASLAGLRHLDLAENPVGPGGLAALAASPHLRGLRVLDLSQLNSARGPIAARDVAAFLAEVNMPELRHLNLDLLPVGARGAKAIASRRAFANLTRLSLAACAVGEAGTKAIIGSKWLTKLVVLDLSANKLGRGVTRLAGRKVLPRLAQCRLGTGIPKRLAAQLRRRPGVRV